MRPRAPVRRQSRCPRAGINSAMVISSVGAAAATCRLMRAVASGCGSSARHPPHHRRQRSKVCAAKPKPRGREPAMQRSSRLGRTSRGCLHRRATTRLLAPSPWPRPARRRGAVPVGRQSTPGVPRVLGLRSRRTVSRFVPVSREPSPLPTHAGFLHRLSGCRQRPCAAAAIRSGKLVETICQRTPADARQRCRRWITRILQPTASARPPSRPWRSKYPSAVTSCLPSHNRRWSAAATSHRRWRASGRGH